MASIVKKLEIHNNENPKKPFSVKVTGNKNYGICDIQPRIGEVLSDFQGRQINSQETMSQLEEALYINLNKKEA